MERRVFNLPLSEIIPYEHNPRQNDGPMRSALAYEIQSAVGDGESGVLLALRYVDGFQWMEIAEKMGYCERQIYRMHGEALNQFQNNKKNVSECQLRA